MADPFPVDLLDYEDPMDEQAALAAVLRQRQVADAQQREALQGTLGTERRNAGAMRSLAFLHSLGDNPTSAPMRNTATGQAGMFDTNAARTESRLAALGRGGMDPASGLLRLRALKAGIDKEKGVQARFDAAQAQRGEQFASTMGFRWADMGQEERLAVMRLAEAKEARDAAAAGKAQEGLDNQTKDLGKEITGAGFPDFEAQYSAVDSILTKFPGDLPGVGFVEGRVPDRFASDDGKKLRYALNQMKLAYQKSITGAGASDAEREAISKATGLMDTNDPDSIRLGVKMLKGVMDEKRAAVEAGYKPEAVETYKKRRQTGPPKAVAPPPTPSDPAAQEQTIKGKRYRLNAKGRWVALEG